MGGKSVCIKKSRFGCFPEFLAILCNVSKEFGSNRIDAVYAVLDMISINGKVPSKFLSIIQCYAVVIVIHVDAKRLGNSDVLNKIRQSYVKIPVLRRRQRFVESMHVACNRGLYDYRTQGADKIRFSDPLTVQHMPAELSSDELAVAIYTVATGSGQHGLVARCLGSFDLANLSLQLFRKPQIIAVQKCDVAADGSKDTPVSCMIRATVFSVDN